MTINNPQMCPPSHQHMAPSLSGLLARLALYRVTEEKTRMIHGHTQKPHMGQAFKKGCCPTSIYNPCQHLPIFVMYQFFPPWDLFQYRAPTELTKAMTNRRPNNTRICTFVTFSTFDLLRGAFVEFCRRAFKISKSHRANWGKGLGRKKDCIFLPNNQWN